MLELIGWILIIISAGFQGFALKALGDISHDWEKRKKDYIKLLLCCFLFLIPGVIMLLVVKYGG